MANLSLRRNQDGNLPTTGRGTPQQGGWDPFRILDSLLRWDPYRELMPVTQQGLAFIPHFEVKETRDAYVFKADLPGVKESDLDLSLTANQLTISGKREYDQEEEAQNFYISELSYGTFTRTFTLPQGADVDKVQADLRNGVLTLVVPKRPEMQPRKIGFGKPGSKS